MRSGIKGWECPYPHCIMSSSRHWNVIRHLGIAHKGVGMPLSQDDFTSKMYKEFANQEQSLSPVAIASSIASASLSSTQNQKRNYDPFDHVLRPLRKAAEVKNLISQLSPSPQGIPMSSSSYAACNPLYNAFSTVYYLYSTIHECLLFQMYRMWL